MRKIFFCLFFLSAVVVIAQKNGDTTEMKKNEFGLSLNSISIGFLGGSTEYKEEFAITYRHFLSEKSALRIRTSAEIRYGGGGFFRNYDSEIISMTDSTQLNRVTYYDYSPIFLINAGYEWHWGKKKVTWFTGGDLVYGLTSSNNKYNTESWKLKKDSTSTFSYYELDSVIYTYRYPTSQKLYGISPIVGLRITLGKHWGFSLQSSFLLSISKLKRETYLNELLSDNDEWWQLDFDFRALFSDFSILFRF